MEIKQPSNWEKSTSETYSVFSAYYSMQWTLHRKNIPQCIAAVTTAATRQAAAGVVRCVDNGFTSPVGISFYTGLVLARVAMVTLSTEGHGTCPPPTPTHVPSPHLSPVLARCVLSSLNDGDPWSRRCDQLVFTGPGSPAGEDGYCDIRSHTQRAKNMRETFSLPSRRILTLARGLTECRFLTRREWDCCVIRELSRSPESASPLRSASVVHSLHGDTSPAKTTTSLIFFEFLNTHKLGVKFCVWSWFIGTLWRKSGEPRSR